MAWRLAESLKVYLNQINEAHPNRSKVADGGIGDEAHQKQGNASDHNPWLKDGSGTGVVTAYDITHDPDNGVDIDKLSDELIASRDPRIKYVIANGLIAGPYTAWKWQPSSGHYNHIHLSVNTNNYDDEKKWNIAEEEPMITNLVVDALFRMRLGRTCDPKQRKDLIKEFKTAEELDAWIKKLPEFKDKVKRAKEGKERWRDFLGTEYRTGLVDPTVEFEKVTEELFRRKK